MRNNLEITEELEVKGWKKIYNGKMKKKKEKAEILMLK
jgi:hypothetical protein